MLHNLLQPRPPVKYITILLGCAQEYIRQLVQLEGYSTS